MKTSNLPLSNGQTSKSENQVAGANPLNNSSNESEYEVLAKSQPNLNTIVNLLNTENTSALSIPNIEMLLETIKNLSTTAAASQAKPKAKSRPKKKKVENEEKKSKAEPSSAKAKPNTQGWNLYFSLIICLLVSLLLWDIPNDFIPNCVKSVK